MFGIRELSKVGEIENGIDVNSIKLAGRRDPLTQLLMQRLCEMKVDQSFLITCSLGEELEKLRGKVHFAAKHSDVKVVTRSRKKSENGEVGLRVWKVRKPHKQKGIFSLSQDGQ